jgi:hypothetical protein
MFYRIAVLWLCACSAPASADVPAGNPLAQYSVGRSERQWREGEVVERLSAGPYVYLKLREPSGQLAWFVSLRATTPADSHVRALVVGRAQHFESRRLGRAFSPLFFAAVRRAATSENLTLQEKTP